MGGSQKLCKVHQLKAFFGFLYSLKSEVLKKKKTEFWRGPQFPNPPMQWKTLHLEQKTSVNCLHPDFNHSPQQQSLIWCYFCSDIYKCYKQKISKFILHALGAFRGDCVIITSFSELSLLTALSYLDMSSYNCCSKTR